MQDESKRTGRPLVRPEQQDPLDSYAARLTSFQARFARRLGDGNLSAGLRYALDFVLRNDMGQNVTKCN